MLFIDIVAVMKTVVFERSEKTKAIEPCKAFQSQDKMCRLSDDYIELNFGPPPPPPPPPVMLIWKNDDAIRSDS